jgi:hypothetical protein
MIPPRALALASSLLLLVFLVPGASAHYVPTAADTFHYAETIALSGGFGDYLGYTETTYLNGSIHVTAVAANGTESATYATTYHYVNSTGANQTGSGSGVFTFSAVNFSYVQGTDNQSGYSHPFVWFFMNNSLPVGAHFTDLNTQMQVLSLDDDYALGTAAGAYVVTISTLGTGAFPRDDSYGMFNATYSWQSFFDPNTGYIVGYLYTEHDQNGSGSGFTLVDHLGVTNTSYSLTPGSAPSPSQSPMSTEALIAVLGIVIVVVLIVVVWAVLRRSRRGAPLPRHSARGQVTFAPPVGGGAPPPIHLTPTGEPAVQQIVVKETVKVNCRYCGSLIDSTVTNCPFCGAART